MHIIVKNYSHVNKAFSNWDTKEGKLVKNKDHYDRLVKEGGYISYEESVEREKNNKMKEYVPSDKAKAIISAVSNSKDKKGNVRLSGRTIKAMQEIGAFQKIPEYMNLPKSYQNKGGFI